MTIKITVLNIVTIDSLMVELEPYERMADVIEIATRYWNEDSEAFVLKKGTKLLPGSRTAEEVNLRDGDTVEIIPDPEGG